MPKERNYTVFVSFGNDIKEARNTIGMSRRELAEKVNIDPRYLANIENSGSLPSLPIFYELVKLCKLPIERYFYPESEDTKSPQRERINLKLSLCSDKYLPIIEATIDGAIKLEEK